MIQINCSIDRYMQDLRTRATLLKGILKDGLYMFPSPSPVSRFYNNKSMAEALMATKISHSSDLWHVFLGHPSAQVVSQVLKHCNLTFSKHLLHDFCDACKLGKIHALPYSLSNSHASKSLELVHTDIWGSSLVKSRDGYLLHTFYR
ncbi:hypothetical protein Scep_010673 [Stephania cephalantha]|uniref:GAG-pre-integrase domain-containing protein n=1 Tax=Stephania cephalantha TaxID=152367 RepID=A0AAP0PEE7_9MAGN